MGGGGRWRTTASTTATVLGSCRRVRCLILINDECGILLLGDAHVIARVILFHNVPGSWIQQNGVLVEFRQFCRTHAHQSHSISAGRPDTYNLNIKNSGTYSGAAGMVTANLLAMRMEAGVCKALALVFTKKSTVSEHNVIDLVSGALPVQAMPFLRRLLALPVDFQV